MAFKYIYICIMYVYYIYGPAFQPPGGVVWGGFGLPPATLVWCGVGWLSRNSVVAVTHSYPLWCAAHRRR